MIVYSLPPILILLHYQVPTPASFCFFIYALTICPYLDQPENTNLRGSITVPLTSCLFCLDSTALLMFSQQHLYFFVKSKPVKQVSRTGILPSMVSVVLELPMSISLSLSLRRRTGSPDRSFLCHPFFILILNEMFSVNYA